MLFSGQRGHTKQRLKTLTYSSDNSSLFYATLDGTLTDGVNINPIGAHGNTISPSDQ